LHRGVRKMGNKISTRGADNTKKYWSPKEPIMDWFKPVAFLHGIEDGCMVLHASVPSLSLSKLMIHILIDIILGRLVRIGYASMTSKFTGSERTPMSTMSVGDNWFHSSAHDLWLDRIDIKCANLLCYFLIQAATLMQVAQYIVIFSLQKVQLYIASYIMFDLVKTQAPQHYYSYTEANIFK
ncbi:hypothetical protein ACJX0J_021842, partial [Zea mays]